MPASKLTGGEKVFHIYSDESSQHGGSAYTVIGATLLRKDAAREVAQELDAIALSNARYPVREFHWADMQKLQAEQYRRLVSLFAERIRAKRMRYSCVLIDNRKLDHKAYSGGDRELGLTKLTFGPIYTLGALRGPFNTYVVFPDKRTVSHSPEAMVYALNNRAKTQFGVDAKPFLKVEPTVSDKSRLIQLTDVITEQLLT